MLADMQQTLFEPGADAWGGASVMQHLPCAMCLLRTRLSEAASGGSGNPLAPSMRPCDLECALARGPLSHLRFRPRLPPAARFEAAGMPEGGGSKRRRSPEPGGQLVILK
eukprot:12832990-Alexandrium_andersonii.AAC.1